ncbi:hypothetical protein ANCDUO_04360, partial [Ancylostoma duodenale]
MALRRKLIELQWFLRMRLGRFIFLGLFLFVVIFVITQLQDRHKALFSGNDLSANVPLPSAWQNSELAGSVDPNTVFVGEKLGNYEPKKPEVPSDQPGEGGQAVFISDEEGMRESKRAEQEYGFNTY